jgi:chemotaxis protein MotD
MTTPGAVADLPAMPPNANMGRLREAGAQRDAAVPSDEAEKGFSELLSKLNAGAGKVVDEGVVPDGSAGRTEPRQVRQREIAARIAPVEGEVEASPRPAVDGLSFGETLLSSEPDLEGAGDTLVAQAAPASPVQAPGPDPTSVNDIAAIVTAKPAGPTLGSGPDALAEPSSARQPAARTVAGRAALDPNLGTAEPHLAIELRPAAKGPLEHSVEGEAPATVTDLILASASAPEAAVVAQEPAVAWGQANKGQAKQNDEGRTRARSTNLIFTSVSAPETASQELPADADVPKVSVLRSETHFAPVLPASVTPASVTPASVTPAADSQSGVSAPAAFSAVASNKLSPAAGAKGNEPAAASPVETALPSTQGPLPVAVPPAQQIADRIAAEAASFEVVDRVPAAPDQRGAKPVLKVLQIQLQPADLGTVTVRMELKAADLKLHVEVDRAETAELIRGDQDTLSKLLRSAGYGVDPSSIRIVEGDRTVASAQAGQQGGQASPQSSTQSQSGWSERQESAQRGHAGTGGGERQLPTNRNDDHEPTTNRTGSDLYV